MGQVCTRMCADDNEDGTSQPPSFKELGSIASSKGGKQPTHQEDQELIAAQQDYIQSGLNRTEDTIDTRTTTQNSEEANETDDEQF